MWCSVQVCRGPLGERLKRADWAPAVQGNLNIGPGRDARTGLVATLMRRDVDREHQVLYPIFDVRVVTHLDGFVVVGYAIAAESAANVIRDVRQAWYCVPKSRA